MNKANVFLLVVVSSLLTYISTATQPAATAGVAQEKWEYGVSECSRSSKFASFTFRCQAPSENVEIFSSDTDLEDTDLQLTAFNLKSVGAIFKLGDQGWHPFQIDVDDRSNYNSGGLMHYLDSRVYWRRRVQ